MKINIKIVVITLLISISSFSQRKITKQNGKEYHTNSSLNDFIGTWQLKDSTQHFKIKLVPKRVDMGHIYFDLLLGYYSYDLKGKLIGNTINSMNPDYPNERTSSGNMENEQRNTLLIKFWDAKYGKYGTARMSFLNGDKSKARWTLGNYEWEQIRIITEDSPYRETPKGFSVPTEMVLEKVEE